MPVFLIALGALGLVVAGAETVDLRSAMTFGDATAATACAALGLILWAVCWFGAAALWRLAEISGRLEHSERPMDR